MSETKKLSWKERREEKKKQKIINKIKEREGNMEKIQEEIKKMALELRDGKLVKRFDGKEPEQEQKVPTPPQPQYAQPQPMMQPQYAQPQPMAQPQYAEPQPMAQPRPQMQNPFDIAAEQAIPQQQFVQPPNVPQFSPQEEMMDVPINFILTGGLTFQFITKLGNLKDILTYVSECINNHEVIELGNRLLNPSQIVFYEY